MHFCSKCDNMYYIKLGEDGSQLIYYCRSCGNETNTIGVSNLSVSKTVLRQHETSSSSIINKYTKLDPTLPRMKGMKCPNAECITNKSDKQSEIIYIRYDDTNVKYINLCVDCDTSWKLNNIN